MSQPETKIVSRALSPQEDHVEHHLEEKLVAQGLMRKDPQGHPQKHGLWKFYSKGNTAHYREEIYEDGALLESQPNIALVLQCLQSKDAGYKQYQAMEAAVGSFNAVLFSLRLLHQSGQGAPSMELAQYLAEVSPFTDVSTLGYLFGELGAPYAPLLEEMAAALLSRGELGQDQQRQAAGVVLGLWRIDSVHLTARLDPLIAAALEGVSFPHFANLNAAYRLGQLLATLPVQRREALLLKKSSYPYYLVSFAWACPTPPIAAALLETIKGWYRGKHDSNYMYQVGALQGLRRFGRPLLEPLLAFLQGEGKKAAQRDLLLIVLVELGAPEAIPALVSFLTDSLSAAKDAARRGLLALGDAALPALQAASAGKKGAAQKGASAALQELQQRLAARALAPSAGLVALREVQASISAAQRQRWLSMFDSQVRDGQLERSWIAGVVYLLSRLIKREAPRDIRALFFYAGHYLSLCRAGLVFEVRLLWLIELCREYMGRSPAIPHLAAEILTQAPREHFFDKVPRQYQGTETDPLVRHQKALKECCRVLGQPLAEPLRELLSRYEAEEDSPLRAWLAAPS